MSADTVARVHDFYLVGYLIDGRAGRIVLHAEAPDWLAPGRKVDVVFEGVRAYRFWDDPMGRSIIFDIEENPLAETLARLRPEFERGFHDNGWPPFWKPGPDPLAASLAPLERDGIRAFSVLSSWGIEGWVLARSLAYVEAS